MFVQPVSLWWPLPVPPAETAVSALYAKDSKDPYRSFCLSFYKKRVGYGATPRHEKIFAQTLQISIRENDAEKPCRLPAKIRETQP
jgi:hypothetical protein